MGALCSLCYRVGGSFEALVLIEADSLSDGQLRAELEQLDPGGECEGLGISPDDARVIPSRFIGRLLDEDEVADLERILVANVRKKPAASSIRRSSRRRKRVGRT